MNKTASAVRRRTKAYDKPFLFMCSEDLLDTAKSVADFNEMSVATFIRQSVKRNISLYENVK